MRLRNLWMLPACLAAAGCMSTPEQIRILEENDAISVTPSASPAYDFSVLIKNLRPLGIDPTLEADRLRIASAYLGDRCAKPKIVSETELATSQPFLGSSSKDYAVRVKC